MLQMKRHNISALALALLLAACNTTTPEQQFIDDAAGALGGPERIGAVTTLAMHGGGRIANLGQDMTWEATGQAFTLSAVTRAMDVAGHRARTEQTRTPNFLYFQGPQPQRQVFGFAGDVAYAIAPNGNATRQPATVARDRRTEFYHHPLTIVRAMLDSPASVADVQAEQGARSADVRIGDTTFVVRLDAAGLPTLVSSPGYHVNMGDVTTATSFADYRAVEGLMLPMRLTTTTDDRTTAEFEVERYSFEAPDDTLAPPPSAASAAVPTPSAPNVEVVVVTDGVWLLAGQSHHSAVIEFADHLTLIEAPQSEARALAVIAKARELVPGKPLTELVMSHHHFDHSSGIRAAVSEGLAVITHQANAAFVEEMVKRTHARQPDALERNRKALTLRTVDDELTLQDATRTVVLYPLPGNPHGDTMVMAYLPRERVLIEIDAYSPGGTYHPYAANLLEAIRARQLRVDRIVPLHGAVVPFDDLVSTVAAQ